MPTYRVRRAYNGFLDFDVGAESVEEAETIVSALEVVPPEICVPLPESVIGFTSHVEDLETESIEKLA